MLQDLSFSSRWYEEFLQQQVVHISGRFFSFSSLSGHYEGALSNTNLHEVDIELITPK